MLAALQYSIYSILTSFAGFSNYDAANVLATASRLVLVQSLHRLYAASYSENSMFKDVKFKYDIPTDSCHWYEVQNLVSQTLGRTQIEGLTKSFLCRRVGVETENTLTA